MSKDREPTVLVVGGGYGGVNVAKALDEHMHVVLVEPKDAFVHSVGTLRALVEPEFLPRIFIPYDNLLARGRVVHDRAVEVHPDRVVVASGDTIAADYLVLASGSSYPFPAKTQEHASVEAIDHFRAAYDELVRADRVLLIGAGAVGIELAGEIVAKWPDKLVTLLDLADDVLGDRFRSDLRAELRNQLVEIGVELVLGEGLRSLPPTAATEFATFTITTETDRTITADIWFQCFGVTPVSDYLRGDLATARRADGFVAVGPTLQLPGHTNVFAIGDMSAADAKMAGLASRQAQLVAANITKLAAGDEDLDEYVSIGTAIVVPIGPEGGSGQLPGQEELASREMVSNAKGRDLMVGRFAQVLGAEPVSS
ncbi:MAG TPA: FAD-dependent oxidoreductase [Acidimicrobiia bacterium]|jgi:NADH dehydrogenase FAD-containing subunit